MLQYDVSFLIAKRAAKDIKKLRLLLTFNLDKHRLENDLRAFYISRLITGKS